MKILITIFIILSTLVSVFSQSTIDYTKFPKNNISYTNNKLISTSGSSEIMYKRVINSNISKLKYLRISMNLDFNNNKNNPTYDYLNVNLNIGIENLKNQGKFSLSYGSELGFSFRRGNNALFLLSDKKALFSGSSINDWGSHLSEIKNGTLLMIRPTVFVGFKYHITTNISFGIESAFGFGVWFSRSSYIDSYTGSDKNNIYSGLLFDTALLRYFTIEYNF